MEDPTIKPLRQKIGMINACLSALGRAKGAAGSEEYQETKAKGEEAKACLDAGDPIRSRELADQAAKSMLACCKLLPKTPRRLVSAQVRQIIKY